MQQGKADIVVAGVTVTDERKAVMDFSDSYATGIQSIVVPEGSDIASPDDLAGKKIGTQRGTTGYLLSLIHISLPPAATCCCVNGSTCRAVSGRSPRLPSSRWSACRSVICWAPVSYTHLDVYKRQHLPG